MNTNLNASINTALVENDFYHAMRSEQIIQDLLDHQVSTKNEDGSLRSTNEILEIARALANKIERELITEALIAIVDDSSEEAKKIINDRVDQLLITEKYHESIDKLDEVVYAKWRKYYDKTRNTGDTKKLGEKYQNMKRDFTFKCGLEKLPQFLKIETLYRRLVWGHYFD